MGSIGNEGNERTDGTRVGSGVQGNIGNEGIRSRGVVLSDCVDFESN
jgi:hypothetical protein